MSREKNPPRRGTCLACGRQSVRLLNPPLVEIPLSRARIDPDEVRVGARFQWTPNSTPSSTYEITEIHDPWGDDIYLICLAPEAISGKDYCYRCFDGHTWPTLRPYVINIPPEMRYNPDHPWWDPVWVSQGRELGRK